MAKGFLVMAALLSGGVYAAVFTPEFMSGVAETNVAVGKSILVTPDFLAVGATEANGVGSVYLRARPTGTQAAQKLTGTSGSFAQHLATRDGKLIVKDAGETRLLRKEGETWVDDGFIEGGSRFLTASGPVVVNANFLISGMEVYSWPGREYLQTLKPTNYTPHYTALDVAMLDGPAVIVYGNGSLWSFPRQEGKFASEGIQISPPDPNAGGGLQVELSPSGFYLFAGRPLDAEQSALSGAVDVYYRGAPGEWNYLQKLKAPLPMEGDQFGAAIAVTSQRLYISAPYRDEWAEQSGAVFVFEVPDQFGVIRWEFLEKLTLKETNAVARLGEMITAYQNVVYASYAGGIVAFHPAMNLRAVRGVDGFLIDVGPGRASLGALQSTPEIGGIWSDFTAGTYSSGFQISFETGTPGRFFRVKLDSAF